MSVHSEHTHTHTHVQMHMRNWTESSRVGATPLVCHELCGQVFDFQPHHVKVNLKWQRAQNKLEEEVSPAWSKQANGCGCHVLHSASAK